jgi:hypothetical protein
MLLNRLAVMAISLALACSAEDINFKKTKLALPREPDEIAVGVTISDDQVLIRNSHAGQTMIEIPFAAITGIAYTESSQHRLSEGAKIAMIAPGIGAATMLSKRRSCWLSIAWLEAGKSSTATLLLDKSEAWNIKTALQSKTGRSIDELDGKLNAFDPTVGSTDVDRVVPFERGRVVAALHAAMAAFGCQVASETSAVTQCRRKHGHSELTGVGGESVIATLQDELSQTHVALVTKKAGAQNRNWSSVIFKRMEEDLAAGR